jgi:hypothetical protein
MWRGGQQPPRQAYPSAPGPGGGPGGYYAPPQPPTSAPAFQAQLQPQPQPPVDPFRSYYADRLRQLTFNSRPLIQELSVLAMQQRDAQHWPNMQSIVEEIEAAVLRVRRKFSVLTPDAPLGTHRDECRRPHVCGGRRQRISCISCYMIDTDGR